MIVLAVPGLKAHFHGLVGQYKADGVTETLCLRRFDSAESVKMFISQNVHFYKEDGNSSLIAFLCSVMLTRGLARTKGKQRHAGWQINFFFCAAHKACVCHIKSRVDGTQ